MTDAACLISVKSDLDLTHCLCHLCVSCIGRCGVDDFPGLLGDLRGRNSTRSDKEGCRYADEGCSKDGRSRRESLKPAHRHICW